MQVSDELRIHWRELLTPLFPNEAEIEVDSDANDFRVRVSWKLCTDPDRPNKRAKIIVVIVPEDAADDYDNKTEYQRLSDDKKLKQYVFNNLAHHDPEHGNPHDSAPPVVEWVAGVDVLNS